MLNKLLENENEQKTDKKQSFSLLFLSALLLFDLTLQKGCGRVFWPQK